MTATLTERETLTKPILSIQQPWAWLILRPDVIAESERAALYETGEIKDVENRTWKLPKTICGDPVELPLEFYVHAGQRFDHEGYRYVRQHWPDIPMPTLVSDFPTGGIVGEAEITGCIGADDWNPSEWCMGDWGFLIRRAKPLRFKPLKGALGFFRVPARLIEASEL